MVFSMSLIFDMVFFLFPPIENILPPIERTLPPIENYIIKKFETNGFPLSGAVALTALK